MVDKANPRAVPHEGQAGDLGSAARFEAGRLRFNTQDDAFDFAGKVSKHGHRWARERGFTVDENLGPLAAAADSLDLIICEVKTPKFADLAQKLPVGKVHATGPAFVPYVRQDLYDKVVEAAGADAAAPGELPKSDSAPRTFNEIAPGHLVIAQEDLETGWWEAIVLESDADTLTLRYRDYPRLPKFQRARTAVALLSRPRRSSDHSVPANSAAPIPWGRPPHLPALILNRAHRSRPKRLLADGCARLWRTR